MVANLWERKGNLKKKDSCVIFKIFSAILKGLTVLLNNKNDVLRQNQQQISITVQRGLPYSIWKKIVLESIFIIKASKVQFSLLSIKREFKGQNNFLFAPNMHDLAIGWRLLKTGGLT